MPMSRKKVHKRLHRSLELQEPVRIFRRDLIDWSLRGFVVSALMASHACGVTAHYAAARRRVGGTVSSHRVMIA